MQVIVTLRDPVDTCISWSIYNGDAADVRLFRSRIQTFTAWHRKVLRISKKCHFQLVSFDDFTQSLDDVLNQVSTYAPGFSSRSMPEVREIEWSIRNYQLSDCNAVEVGNVPHPGRNELKQSYETLLSHQSIQRSLREAGIVYQKLLGLTPAPRQVYFA